MNRFSSALDREIAAYNRDGSGDAAYWKAALHTEMAENRRLTAMLQAAGIDPRPDVTAALAAATWDRP